MEQAELQPLYDSYHRKIAKVDLRFKRYLYSRINWKARIISIKGARGVGKTTMLLQHILENYEDIDQTLYASLDNLWFATHSLMDLVDWADRHGISRLYLDEVHRYEGWSQALKNIYDDYPDMSIVYTSSSLLVLDNATVDMSRRQTPYTLYGLSFREYLDFKADCKLSRNELLDEYIRFGGFPIVALGNYGAQSAYQIVDGIYHTVVSRDIVKRHRINRQDLFDRVVKFVVENMGKTFSANSIATFLKSEHRTISVESIYNYLRWLEQAFVIYPCERYDMQGKSILKTQEKYYLSDVSFKYALLGYNRKMLDGVLENIVFLELKRRGYEVFIGKNNTKEIDFVANRRDERVYVQVCVQLPEHSNREIGNLMEIRDHYPKYVVTLNELDAGIENGIRIVTLADFLLSEQL